MHWQEKVLQKYWHQVITLQIFINKSLFVMNEGEEYCMLYQLSQKHTSLHTITPLQYTAT